MCPPPAGATQAGSALAAPSHRYGGPRPARRALPLAMAPPCSACEGTGNFKFKRCRAGRATGSGRLGSAPMPRQALELVIGANQSETESRSLHWQGRGTGCDTSMAAGPGAAA